ncbi:TIGR02281 family clan AA aspartic protease [Catenovulum sp. 2E275]|uniref:TIGR02281 family clan AA aspartic protease n=1 Tax=Catenovulum sp. 2E275 TaxID=2980497 RepID=UPI0021D36F47|nr:TIGR02281 family clan AA aspartic protease [Catenovulum sp. 2E275]MCU4675102.1 TIGR02281 family clan AA aspartic protease [Catenovulum sp. 2E275]
MQDKIWRKISIILVVICSVSLVANWLLFNAWQQSKQIQGVKVNVRPELNLPAQTELKTLSPQPERIAHHIRLWQALLEQDPEQANLWQDNWLAQAQVWLNQGQTQAYLNFLEQWQAAAPDLIQVKLLHYYWLLNQHNLAEAADIIYPLLNQISPETAQQAELNKLYQLLAKLMPDVLAQQACQQFIETLEMLVWYDNTQPEYLLAISQCYIQLKEFQLAEQQLIYLLADPDYQHQANQLLANMQQKPDEQVPVAKVGEHFIVQANLNQNKRVALMIDTGASITSISRTKFDSLALLYRSLGYKTLATAGGLTQAELVEIENFSVGNKVLADFQLAVLDVPSFGGSDGLLGMNFLSQFPFVIDQQKNILRFTKH